MKAKNFVLFFSFVLVLSVVFSCSFRYNEEELNAPMTYEQAKELLVERLVLDQDKGEFSFSFSPEKEGFEIPEEFLKRFSSEIYLFNRSIREKIDSGEVVTLFDGKNKKTYNQSDSLDELYLLSDKDLQKDRLRINRELLWSCTISNGWASPWKGEFATTYSHVESTIGIGGTNGSYYSVTLECATGNSAFGKTHSLYGTSYIAGAKRYWWYQEPKKSSTRTVADQPIPEVRDYNWKFYVTSLGNNESYGYVHITPTD